MTSDPDVACPVPLPVGGGIGAPRCGGDLDDLGGVLLGHVSHDHALFGDAPAEQSRSRRERERSQLA
jgi:hypothetical protein